MLLETILAAIAIAVLPPLFRHLWKSQRKVVYQGTARPLTRGLEDLGQRTKTRYCWFELPNKQKLFAEIPIDRHGKVWDDPERATITVVKYPFSKPEIESIHWLGEDASEPALGNPPGIVSCVFYLFAGLLALIYAPEGMGTATSMVAFYASAVFLALSGYSIDVFGGKGLKASDVSITSFGKTLGSGATSLYVGLAISLALTAAIFSYPSILILFPGITAAFAVGQFARMLLKLRRS